MAMAMASQKMATAIYATDKRPLNNEQSKLNESKSNFRVSKFNITKKNYYIHKKHKAKIN